MILLRTTEISRVIVEFSNALAAASDLPIVLFVDERNGPVDAGGRPKLGFDRRTYADMGLYVSPDVGWRCGDYGFYIARRSFPDAEHLWMIDYDVRLTGDARRFFEVIGSRGDLDFVAPKLQPADDGWWWSKYLVSSDARPWRCFFPVIRLSAHAVEALYEKRRAHSRQLSRVAMWPNDEGFVATTLVNTGLTRADLNDFGHRFYDDATFSYKNVIDGDNVDCHTGSPELLHPVLTGEAYAKKVARMTLPRHYPDLPLLSVRQALAPRINRQRAW